MCGRGRYSLNAKRKIGDITNACDRNQSMGIFDNKKSSDVSNVLINGSDTSIDFDSNGLHQLVENLSPGMEIPVVVMRNSRLEVEVMTWGLIPLYNSVSLKPNHFALFNKRLDSLHKTGYFRNIVESKRCVVVLDGFYEWKVEHGQRVKQPYYVSLKDNKPLLIAGIYELSKRLDNDKNVMYFPTFSILTGEPSRAFSSLHDRQPVLLTDEQVARWLDTSMNVGALLEELATIPRDDRSEINANLVFHSVTTKMSVPSYQGDDCSTPVLANIRSGNQISNYFGVVGDLGNTSNEQLKTHANKRKLIESDSSPKNKHYVRDLHSVSTAKETISSYFAKKT